MAFLSKLVTWVPIEIFAICSVICLLIQANITTIDPEYMFVVRRTYIAQFFNKTFIDDDMAVLRLERKIDFAKLKHVKPVELEWYYPPSQLVRTECMAMGWGSDNLILYEIKAPLVKWLKCKTDSDQLVVCAGYPNSGGPNGEGICYGDSGSPLKGKRQVGVLSYFPGAGVCGKEPGMYVRASAHAAFIMTATDPDY